MKEQLDVSIIIATAGQRSSLRSTVFSVLRQQSVKLEIIVILDGSDFKSGINIEDIPGIVTHRTYKRLGQASCLNIGIAMAKGKYIAICDDDDFWMFRTKLVKQIEIFQKDENRSKPLAVVSCGKIPFLNRPEKEVIHLDKQPQIRCIKYVTQNQIKKNNIITHSGVLFRKDILNEIGGYNENLERAQDLNLWLRLLQQYNIAVMPERYVMYEYRKSSIARKISEKFRKILALW